MKDAEEWLEEQRHNLFTCFKSGRFGNSDEFTVLDCLAELGPTLGSNCSGCYDTGFRFAIVPRMLSPVLYHTVTWCQMDLSSVIDH